MSTVDDIPKPLLKLLRLIMRGFYNIELKLIMDMLVRRRETKEDDLVDILKFERKYLRSLIQQLKQDKFINVRLIMETGLDGKSIRHNYYSVNYRKFVNVVKYRIDHMRRKLETEEREQTNRACFICEQCKKKYTDLEVGQIYDPMRGQFCCSYCDGLVDEDPDVKPKTDSRFLIAEFNQQLESVYSCLQETENINWSLLEADKVELDAFKNLVNSTNSTAIPDTTNITSKSLVNLVFNKININELHRRQNSLVNKFYNISINDDDEENVNNGKCENIGTFNYSHGFEDVQEDNTGDDCGQEEESTLMVNVSTTKVPFNKLTDDHIALMSPSQRLEYERLTRHIYYIVFD